MTRLNEIFVYAKAPNRYYTDGEDLFVEVQKEKFAKFHRISINGVRIRIKSQFDCPSNYVFVGERLFKRLSWQRDKNGYGFIMIGGKTSTMKVSKHRLVYFYNNNICPSDGMVVDHINRDKSCNNVENLRLVTPKENSNNIDLDKCSNRQYKITNRVTGDVYVGKPYKIALILGADSGSLNRYAKHNFLYNHIWKVEVVKDI